MLTAGYAFLDLTPGTKPHLWIVCTNPNDDGEVVIVSITTKQDWIKDLACELHAGDHPFIDHDSVAAYQRAKVLTISTIEARHKQLHFQPKAQAEPRIVERLREGALASEFTPNIVKGCIRRCNWQLKNNAEGTTKPKTPTS